MKKLSVLFLLAAMLLMMGACSKPYYQAKGFKKTTATHKKVAILPVQMILSGFLGFDLDEEEKVKMQEAESKAFQISLQNQLLKSSAKNNKGMRVQIQPITRTNKILEENDISITDSWEEDPEELADLLGVDAVIISRVEKKRYFSDLTSYGIDIGVKLISALSKNILPLLAGKGATKSNDIYSNINLINGADGSILWSMTDQMEADWTQPSNEVIDALNYRMAKHFPYK